MSASLRSKSLPSSKKTSPENAFESSPDTTILLEEESVLHIPGCTVNLVQEGEAVEIANGYFNLVKLSDENVPSVILVKVGDELQWPLTKDEPVVKLDDCGVSFSQQSGSGLTDLDSFLKEHSCFTGVSSSSTSETTSEAGALNWAENVQKGGAMVITETTDVEQGDSETENNKSNRKTTGTKKGVLRKGLARARTFSEMAEKSSKTVLTIVEMGTESAVGPISSHAEKQILATVPGKVFLDSLGAFGRLIDAAEVAEQQALCTSSKAAAKMVSNRLGESAGGEGATIEDIFAIAGHLASTAFNVVKIQSAMDPASSVSSTMAKNAIMKNL
ncbi:hypothetical protein MKX01_000860 [Papaver californicum]|nr:hypothetical protein MKX01_000860 [Papaver californicum]